ncbi:MAG: hypothetical protein ACRD11_13780 [Terriglobia bacterium]
MANPHERFFIDLAAELSLKQRVFVRWWIEQLTTKFGTPYSSPREKTG